MGKATLPVKPRRIFRPADNPGAPLWAGWQLLYWFFTKNLNNPITLHFRANEIPLAALIR